VLAKRIEPRPAVKDRYAIDIHRNPILESIRIEELKRVRKRQI
jgi:hypothetical protein